MELILQNIGRLKEKVKAPGAGTVTQDAHIRRYLSHDESAGAQAPASGTWRIRHS